MSDDLNFDPNEPVVPVNTTHYSAPPRPNRPPVQKPAQPQRQQMKPIVRAPDPTGNAYRERLARQAAAAAAHDQENGAAPAAQPARPAPRPPRPQQNVNFSEGPQQRQAKPQPQYQPHPSRVPQRAAPVDEQEEEVEHYEAQALETNPGYVAEPLGATKPMVLDSRYEEVFLPSGFVSYASKKCAVRRFTVEELRSIVRARVSGSMRHLVHALDNTLSISVYDLTVGDFWWLMYWHRLNSYKKTPFVIDWTCNDPEHVKRVEQKLVEPKDLRNVTTIRQSNLTTVEINPEKYQQFTENFYREYGLHLRPQTVADFMAEQEEEELLELRRKKELADQQKLAGTDQEQDEIAMFLSAMSDVSEDEDRNFMHRYASVLGEEHGRSLKERVEFLNQQAADVLTDMEEFVTEVSDHGVEEKFHVTCRCGASRVIEQTLDALSFLPSLQRGGHS